MIKVKFYGILKPYMPSVEEDGFWHLEQDGLTIQELLDMSGAGEKDFGMTILVNRRRKEKDYVLQDGDVITVMPLVAGG